MSKYIDLTGQKFGRLMVLSQEENVKPTRWKCICICGVQKTVPSGTLMAGRTISCGCLRREHRIKRNTTHGMTNTPEHRIWSQMKSRCSDSSHKSYKDYGGRGIAICDRWKESFELFFEDMGSRPSKSHSIERVDNEQGYSKENCKWATSSEQNRNKRNNVFVTIAGDTKSLAEWVEHSGISRHTLYGRIKAGWREEDLLKPLRGSKTLTIKGTKTITLNGVTKKVGQWAKEAGLGRSTILARINMGWPIDESLLYKPQKVTKI